MNNDVLRAKQILLENDYTCVLCSESVQYTSNERGVKPLLQFLQTGEDFSTFCAADKVIGAGAAHLYVLLKVKALWTGVISESALEVLKNGGIEVEYAKLVPHIINRAGDGLCPIESAVSGIANSKEALKKIKETLKALQNK